VTVTVHRTADDADRAQAGHHGQVSQPAAPPPDPVRYDSPRAARARAKGLDAPYIAGGEDPDPGPALAEERRLGRLLVAMVVTILASGFVIGTIIALAGPTGGR
jgi:hypothetical protein